MPSLCGREKNDLVVPHCVIVVGETRFRQRTTLEDRLFGNFLEGERVGASLEETCFDQATNQLDLEASPEPMLETAGDHRTRERIGLAGSWDFGKRHEAQYDKRQRARQGGSKSWKNLD